MKRLAEIQQALGELSEVDASSLDRTDDLTSTINFSQAVPHLREMLSVCSQLSERDLSRLPKQQLDAIGNACSTISSHIDAVNDFDINQNTPLDVCNSIVASIEKAYDSVMNPLLLPLAFTATQATDYAKIEREAKGYHATMQEEMEGLRKFMSTAQAEGEQAMAVIRKQAAESGVSQNAQIFVDEAKEHKDRAFWWLISTVISGAITITAAVVLLVIAFKYTPTTPGEAIQYVFAKLILLSTLTLVLVWCSRNYRSHRHNQVLNQHRANALRTFRAFVEGTSDDRVKDAVLLQASQAAFVGRPTGYDTPDKDSQTINPVVEVLGKSLPKTTVPAQ